MCDALTDLSFCQKEPHKHIHANIFVYTEAIKAIQSIKSICSVLIKPDDSIQIQVVGRLVQHQQRRLHEESPRGHTGDRRRFIYLWPGG